MCVVINIGTDKDKKEQEVDEQEERVETGRSHALLKTQGKQDTDRSQLKILILFNRMPFAAIYWEINKHIQLTLKFHF